MSFPITVSLDPDGEKYNPQQRKFFDTVMGCLSRSHRLELLKVKIKEFPQDGDPDHLDGMIQMADELKDQVDNDYRFFFYGGGVSGGKTHISLALFIIAASTIYPNSRWHVVRESMSSIEQNVIPSIQEILEHSDGLKWKRTKSDYYCEFPNKSRIYFIGENFAKDKDQNKFKGLKSNGFILEQIEELQYKTFEKCIERAGRWYGVIGPMPPPIIISTFNPTYGWVKKKIHDEHRRGKLNKKFYYLQALPKDSPWNTEEQWSNWENLDPETYARFIEGKWDLPIENQFFNYFSEERNVSKDPLELDLTEHIVLSFDFNVEPMTCTMQQSDGHSYMRVLKEFRAMPSDTYALCELIRPIIYGMEHLILITGDASGSNRISGARNHINHYEIVKAELGLKNEQFRVPSANPFISDSRVFMNSLFYRLPEFLIDSSCEYLIQDLKFLEVAIDNDGKVEIQKTGINKSLQIDNKLLGHMSDTLRYGCHSMLPDWLKLPKS